MSIKETVVIAMSGGVDSSVAALLLKEQGYNCIGVTMKLWDYELVGGNLNYDSGCCSLDSINDARMVCAKIGIPHYVMNFSREFHDGVVDDFINEYIAGRTPNPCVQCNTKIKWQTLIEKAQELGASRIATGHYARVRENEASGLSELYKGMDQAKDQSYALWGIRQQNLAKTIFPLGELSKPQIREIANAHNLRTANKAESMEICFVADNDYNRFLKEAVPGLEEKVKDGTIVDKTGREIGRHKGYPFFTIGQRRGIGTGFGKPMYVIETDAQSNVVKLGEDKELFSRALRADQINWISGSPPEQGMRIQAKIRYKSPAEPARVLMEKASVRIEFEAPQRAVTPGQSVVFYNGDQVLGGGIIQQAISK